jgi:hypothetical protein
MPAEGRTLTSGVLSKMARRRYRLGSRTLRSKLCRKAKARAPEFFVHAGELLEPRWIWIAAFQFGFCRPALKVFAF